MVRPDRSLPRGGEEGASFGGGGRVRDDETAVDIHGQRSPRIDGELGLRGRHGEEGFDGREDVALEGADLGERLLLFLASSAKICASSITDH